MAATVNQRDILISSETRKISITYPSDFSYQGDLIGTINGVDTTTVLSDIANSDNTVEILENSGTAIAVTSSALFTMPGGGAGGVFIGSGGLIGKNSGGTTKFTLSSSTGLLTVEDAIVNGTLTAGSVIANTVTIDGTNALTVKNNANTGASHAGVSGSNPHNTPLSTISGDLDDIANGSIFFKTTSNEKTGAGRAFNALDSSNEYVRSLVSTKLTVVGGNPSTGWVGDANGIRMYQSGSLRVDIPVSGDPSFSGNITGGSNITISGTATFNGSNSVTEGTFAVTGNNSLGTTGGILGKSTTGSAIYGGSTNGTAGFFTSQGNFGVRAICAGAGGVGLEASGTSGADALEVNGNIIQNSGSASIRNVIANGQLTLTSQSYSTVDSVAVTFSGATPSGDGGDNDWLRISINGSNKWIAVWDA